MAKVAHSATHERLLDESAALFHAHGFAGTSIRQIALAMNLETASLYHYMSSKADILFEISRRSLEEITAGVTEATRGEAGAAERIRRAMVTHIELVLGKLSWHAAMLFEMRSLPPSQREQIVLARDAYETLFDALIGDGRESGLLTTSTPRKMQRLALLNLVNWPMTWYRPGGDMTPSQIGHHLADVFLFGVSEPTTALRSSTRATP